MDLQSYIRLKESYKNMHTPQPMTEEVEAVEEEILDENRQNRANELRAARQSAAASKPEPTSGGAKSFADRIAARRSSSPAAKANTNKVGQNVKGLTGSSSPKPPATSGTSKPPAASGTASAKPAAPKPAASKPSAAPAPAPKKDTMASSSKSDRMAAWAKANPKLANKPKTPNPLMSKPKAAPAAKPSPAGATGSSRLAKALSGIKPMKTTSEEVVSEFDIILSHLLESGFPMEEALIVMVNMSEEKQKKILEETGEEYHARMAKKKMPWEEPNTTKSNTTPEVEKKLKDRAERIKAEKEEAAKKPKKQKSDAEKMADATGPRKGSNYRGD